VRGGQPLARGPVADDHHARSRPGAPRPLERAQAELDVLLQRDAADHEQDRRALGLPLQAQLGAPMRRRKRLAVDTAPDRGQVVEPERGELRSVARVGTKVRSVRLWNRRSTPSSGVAKAPTP
jgi:hypothetical protein